MLQQNKNVFDMLGILDYHQAGITGKGIKIGVMDAYDDLSESYLKDHVHKVGAYRGEPINVHRSTHGITKMDLLKQVAPDAEIYFGQPSAAVLGYHFIPGEEQFGIPRDVPGGVDIVSMSIGFPGRDPLQNVYEIVRDHGLHFNTSAGNEGAAGLTVPASYVNNRCRSVGACDENLKIREYSSRGKELDVVSIDGLYANTNGRIHRAYGTSYSEPIFTGMMSLMMQVWRENKPERRIPPYIMDDFIRMRSKDIDDQGFDVNSGHGLFILPPHDILT